MRVLRFWEQVHQGEPEKDLDWIENFVRDVCNNKEFKCQIKKRKNKVIISDGTVSVEIEDNNKPNDFFFVRVIKDNTLVMDYERHESGEQLSPDELPSESIAILVSRYFQKVH